MRCLQICPRCKCYSVFLAGIWCIKWVALESCRQYECTLMSRGTRAGEGERSGRCRGSSVGDVSVDDLTRQPPSSHHHWNMGRVSLSLYFVLLSTSVTCKAKQGWNVFSCHGHWRLLLWIWSWVVRIPWQPKVYLRNRGLIVIFVVQIRSVQLYYFTVIIVIVIFIKDALIPEEVCPWNDILGHELILKHVNFQCNSLYFIVMFRL